MGKLKQLASETAIYGMTTIVARIINFLMVPLYTRKLAEGEYGVYSEIFAYVPVLLTLFIFGMETTFFRFATKKDSNPDKVFSTIQTFITIVSCAVLFLGIVFAQNIANAFGYENHPEYIWCTAAVLACDTFTSVLFARLRFQKKALKFGIFKVVKILFELAFNFILFFGFPIYAQNNPDSFLLKILSPTPNSGYILFAVLGSGIISILLFLPELIRTKMTVSSTLWKQLIIYAFPIVLAQMPGVLNDVLDRILFRYFAPGDHFALLGIFNANVKLAVFLTLFVQMFRFAAEPFFFSLDRQADQKKTYADVMKYFVIFCMLIFLVVALYIDIFKFFIGKEYRVGIGVVPIMLMANVFLGITFNLSMWYKVSGQTKFAINITLAGLLVTFVINAVFMPHFGYYAAAAGHFFSYLAMILVSWWLCKKYYPIPYDWKNISIYIIAGVLLFAVSYFAQTQNHIINFAVATVLILIYIVLVIKKEKINLGAVLATIKKRGKK